MEPLSPSPSVFLTGYSPVHSKTQFSAAAPIKKGQNVFYTTKKKQYNFLLAHFQEEKEVHY